LQDTAVASSQQSFIDEYFSGEYETMYLFVAPEKCVLMMHMHVVNSLQDEYAVWV